ACGVGAALAVVVLRPLPGRILLSLPLGVGGEVAELCQDAEAQEESAIVERRFLGERIEGGVGGQGRFPGRVGVGRVVGVLAAREDSACLVESGVGSRLPPVIGTPRRESEQDDRDGQANEQPTAHARTPMGGWLAEGERRAAWGLSTIVSGARASVKGISPVVGCPYCKRHEPNGESVGARRHVLPPP